MGFEPQIRKILDYCPLERQTLMFTATWPKEVRRLASEFLEDPCVLYVGAFHMPRCAACRHGLSIAACWFSRRTMY